jgi:hypothetical protein
VLSFNQRSDATGREAFAAADKAYNDCRVTIIGWTSDLLLDPSGTIKRLATNAEAAGALERALTTCQDKALIDFFERTKVWAMARAGVGS